MPRIEGDLTGLRFSASSDNGRVTGAVMTIETEAALNFFRKLSVTKPRLVDNAFGLYSFGSIGRNGKVKFASLGEATPHMLRPRGNTGCIWEPVGGISMEVSEFSVCPVKYQGQVCADAFWGTLFEKMLGVGNQIEDIYATPEGRLLMAQLINAIYRSLGNSLWNLAWFAAHPLIADATADHIYEADEEEWANFVAQQAIECGGWMTLIDALKESALPHYNVVIPETAIGIDGEYVGDVGRPNGLFSKIKKSGSKAMMLLNGKTTEGSVTGASIGKAPILVTPAIFEAYEKELMLDWGNLPETFYFQLTGEYVSQFGLDPAVADGVLKWKGHYVICMEDWGQFYDMVGVEAHIAMQIIPGVLGMAFDVPSLDQFNGLGMIVEQKRGAPELGKVYLHTNFDIGMGIANEDLITYAGVYLPKA
jgi:hypothetical protein